MGTICASFLILRSIFFSNNEHYVTVIGERELMIIDTKHGKILTKMQLPKWEFYEKIETFGGILSDCVSDCDDG